MRALIAKHGVRNGLLTSVAPTGTISLLADNVSSGIEPVFALAYTRKVREPDGSTTGRGGVRLRAAPVPATAREPRRRCPPIS